MGIGTIVLIILVLALVGVLPSSSGRAPQRMTALGRKRLFEA